MRRKRRASLMDWGGKGTPHVRGARPERLFEETMKVPPFSLSFDSLSCKDFLVQSK